jgi:hypothetical protein
MGRPRKVQSNIPQVPQPPTVAEDEILNSEQEELYYRQVMTGEIPPPPNPLEDEDNYTPQPPNTGSGVVPPTVKHIHVHVPTSNLYLVEGKVRLQSTLDPASSQVADQRRIVNAADADEALQKFIKYYESMSNETHTYSVLQAGASETIL